MSIASDPSSGTALAPNASATYTVQFAPTATGESTGDLTINSDATNSPAVVSLQGASISQPVAGAPVLFFTDLDSGPNVGGETVGNFAGSYVTLYGTFFGSAQGTSTITWNGLDCLRVVPAIGNYNGWGTTYFWYQKIVVQLGSSCTAGSGDFVVTVNGQASNPLPFTVRSGNIHFVATTGSDSNPGTAASPFATLPHCRVTMVAGDICYAEDGVQATAVDGNSVSLDIVSGGNAGSPVAFVAYPGAVASVISTDLIGYALRVPQVQVSPAYVTIAGLHFSASNLAFHEFQGSNWRVIANNFQCPGANGQVGCYESSVSSNIKFLGNETTNVGATPQSQKEQHAVYFSTDSNHIEAAWNFIHDNRSCTAMQFHSSPLGGSGGFQQFDLSAHDNLIHDDPCDGINFATIDPSQGKVEAYNNVIYHVGLGPDPPGAEASYSCLYFPQILNNGAAGSGTVEIYNNTLYDCGSHVGTFHLSGTYSFSSGPVSFNLRNNINYESSGEFYNNSGFGLSGVTVTGENNVWFGSSSATPTFTTGNITSDPLFVNLSGNDFHLQSGSPARDAGITITSGNSYHSYQVWNLKPYDRDGVSRPQGSAYDVGAFEFH